MPNPANRETMISFEVPERCRISVTIYDVAGRRVKTVLDEDMEKGIHKSRWDGCNEAGKGVSPGMYFCRVSSDNQSDFKKIVLLKKGGI
jgi:flagellar hook assembly protein FlgD